MAALEEKTETPKSSKFISMLSINWTRSNWRQSHPKTRSLSPVFNCPSFAVRENKVCDKNSLLYPISILPLLWVHTFTFFHVQIIHFRAMIWECLLWNARRGRILLKRIIKQEKQSCWAIILHWHSMRWMRWFGPGVGFTSSALPAFVGLCLGWYVVIKQGCPGAWPLLYRLLLKDQTLR